MRVALLTIGDELLIGQVLNSNAQWMGETLTALGATVCCHLTVGDTYEAIEDALKFLTSNPSTAPDSIMISGGLGPTHDDLTLEALSRFFAIPLKYDQEWINKVEAYFKARNRPMAENNKKQGYLLSTAKRIDNEWGTAAGQHFEAVRVGRQSQEVFVVPGVPHEMKGMMQNYILPALSKKTGGNKILKETLLVTGIGESALAEKCASVVSQIKTQQSSGKKITLAFLPSATVVKLRLQMPTAPATLEQDEKLFQKLTAGKC